MSRSGYSDDCDDILFYGRWRAQIASATRGQRGQKLFKDLLAALDSMPEKRLITEELKASDGGFCALGVLGEKRGIALEEIDPYDRKSVANHFDIATQLAQEIVYMNDEYYSTDTPEDRWVKMRAWVEKQISK